MTHANQPWSPLEKPWRVQIIKHHFTGYGGWSSFSETFATQAEARLKMASARKGQKVMLEYAENGDKWRISGYWRLIEQKTINRKPPTPAT